MKKLQSTAVRLHGLQARDLAQVRGGDNGVLHMQVVGGPAPNDNGVIHMQNVGAPAPSGGLP
jgi:hypothetical protein